MPIPDLSNKPGPGRPGWPGGGSYDFQFEVAAGQVGITVVPRVNGLRFTIKWQDGTEQAITSAQTNLQSPTTQAGIISINNEELDTTWCDDFAVASGKQFVTKVISWGRNPWNRLNNAFKDCTNLTDISTTSLIADTGANIIKMFSGCTSLLEADIRNWDLTAGVNWYGGSPFGGLVNLEKLDMTGMTIKLTARSDNAFSSVGSATTDGCELLMSNIDWSTSTSAGTYTVYWFTSVRFKNTSDLSGWKFPSSSWAGTGMFNSAKIIGTDAVLNLSNWTTYSGSLFPSFSSFNSGLGNTGAKIDLTNMGMSNVNSMSNSFYFTDVSKIIGLSTWGATAGNVNMNRTFWGSDHLSFSDDDNFSNTFIQSLTPTRIDQTFMSVGVSSPNGVAPNISNIDLSGCTTTSQAFSGARFTNVPDLASATFSSTSTIAMDQTFNGIRISDADAHVDFSNTAVKISSAVQMFSGAHIDKVTFGNNVDFSSLTTVTNMFYYPGNPIEVKFPNNADFSSLASTGNWFAGLQGPTTGPLTTCQIDNLIRRFRATAYGNALNVNFYQGQITEAPSVVRNLEAELVANGWTITENSTDATMPFEYTGPFQTGTNITPTINTSGGTFSSSDVTVNATTGTFNSSTAVNATIRYTFSDGCYNEQVLNVVPPFTPFKFRVTGPISIKAQPAATGSFTIDWGDGTSQTTTGSNSIASPNYPAGTYDIQINAQSDTDYCDNFAIVSGQTNVTEVLDWGEKPWGDLQNAFLNCTNLTSISTTTLTTGAKLHGGITYSRLTSAFQGCTSLTNVNISSWDMTNGAGIQQMFDGCTGLEVFETGNLNININYTATNWLRNTGSAVTDGCEYRMNGLNVKTSNYAANLITNFFVSLKINPASSFANISWPTQTHSKISFQSSSITGVNSTLDCSGWTDYNSSAFPYFQSFTATEGGTSNMKINITNLNVSNVTSFNRTFMSSQISEIIGLGGLGATAGVTNAEYAFLNASYMKFTNHNFSSAFINSFNLGASNFVACFNGCGFNLAPADASSPPNLHSLDLSSVTSLSQAFYRSRFSTAPDFSNVTMSPTTAYTLSGCFQLMALSDNSNVNSLFSKTFKVSNFTSTFSTTTLPSIIIGNGVDFSSCTTMTRMFQNATATDVQLPTNMDLGNMTGVNSFQYSFLSGPTLSVCQVDNFVRRLHATALTNGISIDFKNGALTESPAVVQSLKDELVSNGWSITTNSTDATIPFEYTGTLEPDTNITPTNNTGSAFTGTFTSSNSNIAVNSSTGLINTSTGGNTTIRYTLANGCYTEQEIVIESPMLMVWRTTAPSESVGIVGQTLGSTDEGIYYDFTIDWGDSTTVESYSGTAGKNISHTYANAGDYEVKISGKYPGINANSTSDRTKLIEFKQWGTCVIRSFINMFNGCSNMTYTATDSPNWNGSLSNRGFDSVFRSCSSITSLDLSNWSSSMLSYAWDQGAYARYSFSGCTKAEQITLPDGINTSARDHGGMFQSCGTATTDGVEITFKNYTNGRGSGVSLSSFMNGTKIKFADLTYWTIVSASASYLLKSNVDVTGNYVDMSNWTTTGNGLSSFYLRSGRADEVRINNWNANMTQNIGSLSHAWYTTDVEKVIGLENWNFNGVTNMRNFMAGMSKLSFSTGRNFGTNSMTSGNLTDFSSSFSGVGVSLSSAQQADSYAPNISNWNTSSVTNFGGLFYNAVFNLSDIDVSNWDFSSATSLGTMFRRYNRSAISRSTRTYEVVISNLSNSCTTLGSMCRESAVTDIDLRGSDLSAITSIDHFWLSSYAPSGHVKRFRIDTNADLSSVSNMGNFAGTIHTDDYDLLLTRLEATNNNTGVSMSMAGSKFSAGLIFPDVRTKSMTDSTTANKIIDENVDFVELGVSVGDIVETRTGNNYYLAKVSAVVSSTELTLDANIVASGRTYNVQTSDVAKARYDLDVTQSWAVGDGGPVIQ